MINNRVSKVILSFDDGRKDNIDVAKKVLEKYNLKATFNITTGYIDNTIDVKERPCVNPALTINDVAELRKNTLFEIAGHGQDHLNDLEDWKKGINKLKQWLGENWGKEGIGVASPHCGISEQSIDIQRNNIRECGITYVRIGLRNQNSLKQRVISKLSYITHSKLLFYISAKRSLQIVGSNMHVYSIPVLHNHTIRQLKYTIMKAEMLNLDCVFMFHSIMTAQDRYYNDLWTWDVKKFEELCRWLKAEQDNNRIQVIKNIEVFE